MTIEPLHPWYWRSLPLEGKIGSEVFAALFLQPGAIGTLLESPYSPQTQNSNAGEAFARKISGKVPTVFAANASPLQNKNSLARYSICAGVPRIVNGKHQLWTPPIGEILPFLRRLLAANYPLIDSPTHLPFNGGWLGWLGYDLAWEIERLPKYKPDPLPFPVAYWYEPECFAVLDHLEQTIWLAATELSQLDLLQTKLENIKDEDSSLIPEHSFLHTHQSSSPTKFYTNQEEYESNVRKAKKYIQAGDIFQANLTLRFEAQTTSDSWTIYRALQQINPSPFASYWQTPWGAVISCSPERLVKLEERQVQTRPIAGTRSRSADPIEDAQKAQELFTNIKENAEHIMLVDLERNDLGRVCEWGSVIVDEFLTIERYSHVMHLVSNIIGNLRSDCDPTDLIRAVFPGGTITGCPKVRCMEIIEELEPVRRSLFYGSCGYLDWRGNLDLNILIRTLLFTTNDRSPTSPHNIVWGQVGAGIVADSDPEKEWHESIAKAQAQLIALHWAEMPIQGDG